MSQADRARDHVPTGRRGAFLVYLAASTAVGGGLFVALLVVLLRAPGLATLLSSFGFWLLLAMVVFGEARPLYLPGLGDPTGIVMSSPFAFGALLHYGLPAAALAHAVGVLVTGVVRRRAWWRTAFNCAQYTLSLAAAEAVLHGLGYHASPLAPGRPTGNVIAVIVLAGLAYFVVNDLLVGAALALMQGEGLVETVRSDLGYQAAVNTALLSIAPLVAVVMSHQAALVPLFMLPLIAIYKNAGVSLAREHEALHDALTGLANRTMLLERTEAVLRERRRTGGHAALFLLDLDRFKEINDTLGHPTGDRVLALVAARLQASLRPEDVVARLGGDEFAVLLPQVRDVEAAREVADRLRAGLADPFHLDRLVIDVQASIGIAMFPEHGGSFDRLHQRADVAMYLAKGDGRGVEVYSPEKDNHSPERLSMLGELRKAIEHGQLEVHYQPQGAVASPGGDVVGVEALVRWRHPTRGLVMPDEFIPVAEQSDLMVRLTDEVLDQALAQAAQWRAPRGHPDVRVAVNVSARDLGDPGFADRVADALTRHQVPAELLVLEITERLLIGDFALGAEVLGRLRAIGVRISLDDFGTGYSSLTLLKALPVNQIKIDRSFVASIHDVEADATIVRSIVELAHGLGLGVVAEGVETQESLRSLATIGCDHVQGWLVGRPMPTEAAGAWIAAHRDARASAERLASAPVG